MAGGIFGGGNGSISAPYLIEDVDDLNVVRSFPGANFKLVSNINLGVPPYSETTGWTPINNFTGSFDGNGKKIYNLYINRPGEDDVGLFGKIVLSNNSATDGFRIRNLSLENVNITGRANVGALTGFISMSYDSNRTEDSKVLIGGISVSGKLQAQRNVGGIVGHFKQNYDGASFTYLAASNCFSSINIREAEDYIGQIIGVFSDAAGTPNAKSKFQLQNCIATGVFGPSDKSPSHHGHLVFGNNVNMSNCFVDVSNWTTTSGGEKNEGLKALSTSDMKSSKTFESLQSFTEDDGVPTWSFADGRYPELWHASPDYMFVFSDGHYYIYDASKKNWNSLFDIEPSIQQAIMYGMRHIEYIPTKAWDFFRNASNAYIANILEKTTSVSVRAIPVELAKDAAISSDRKTVFRKLVSFSLYNGGTLSSINL